MSIRPVVFNGMIQNTHDVANTKINEDNKPTIQQANITQTVEQEAEQKFNSVTEMENANQHEYRYGEGEGNGTGYEGNKKKKPNDGKEKKGETKDGVVYLKNAHTSFETTI